MVKKIFSDTSFKLAILLTLLFLGCGFGLLHYGLTVYGWAFFILLPIVIGISIGALPSIKWAYRGLTVGFVLFLGFLLVGELEGFLCVLMASPIILSFIFLGSVIAYLYKRSRELEGTTNLNAFITPLLFCIVFLLFENQYENSPKIIEAKTGIILPYSVDRVFDEIKSVGKMDASKSVLFWVGLPEPQRCVLEKEAVGAKRICYFEGGKIVEQVTEFEKGKVLKMDVIDYQLTGRSWLGFDEAIYTFEEMGPQKTRLTRITTYTSVLYPRMYWEPLEMWGIQAEHEYVFENLKKDLSK